MWAGIINNLKFCHPESGDDIGSPPPDNMDAFRHRAGDFANLWFALLTCMGETPDGSEWRLPGISMMYGSGKTTVGQGTLSAVQQPAVQGMLREKVEAMPPGLNRLRTRARLCQLLCLMSATGPNTIGARTRYRDRNDTLRLSRGNVVYVHVNLHRCSTWREVVMALHIAVSTIQDFHMLDHPVLRLVLDILASNTTQFVPHDVAAAAACVGGVFVHFDEVGTLSSEAAQALCSHCRLCAGTVKFVPLYFLCTGRVLPLPCGAESPSDVYRLVALSLMTKDHIRILLQWVLRTHGIEMTGVDRAVRFAVGEHTSPHFNLTLFVDKVHEGTGGAPRLVLICHLSLVFRVLYRPGGLQFRLDPTAIVDHASEEIQKHRRRELYDVQGLVAGSPLRQGFKVALMCAMTKTRVTDRTVFEPTGCVTLATLMRHAPVFTSAVPGEGGDSVVVVAPDFALQLIKQALILPDEQALIRCVRSPYTRADEIDRLFELAAAFSINTALIEDSLCGVLASGCPLAECFPFLQGTKVAAQVIFPASTTMQDMPTVSASTKNPQVSMLPCNLASFLQSRPAGYYVPLEWNSESADAYVVVGHGVDRSIVAFQYKAGDSSAATITVLRNELATASCQPPTTVPMVFVLLCQLGIGPELTPFIGDADALRLGPGEWQLGNVRKGSLSLPCLLNSTSGQLLCCGGGHVPCEGGTPILIGGITFHYNFDKSLHEQLHTATFIPTESSVPVVVPDLVEVVVPTKSATRAFLGARRSKALDSLKDRSKEPIDTFRAFSIALVGVLITAVRAPMQGHCFRGMCSWLLSVGRGQATRTKVRHAA